MDVPVYLLYFKCSSISYIKNVWLFVVEDVFIFVVVVVAVVVVEVEVAVAVVC